MSVQINRPEEIAKRLGIDEKGKVHAFATSRCAYYMDDYVPMRQGSGNLKNNKWVFTDYICYHSIYAHYMFEGKVMGPNIPIKNANGEIVKWISPKGMPKHYTGADIVYHPEGTQRGAYWHEKMKTACMSKIVKEVQDYMRTGATR